MVKGFLRATFRGLIDTVGYPSPLVGKGIRSNLEWVKGD